MKKSFLDENVLQRIMLLLVVLVGASPAVAAGDWQRLYPWYPTHGYNDIFAVSPDDVFAVGGNGLIYHYDGSSWSEMDSPTAENLRAVWGRSANEVYAVGNRGTIIRYNGTKWEMKNTPIQVDLYCVWGFPTNDGAVYAGGRDGQIWLYDGGDWTRMDTPFSDGIWRYSIIHAVWGDTSSNLYAVGWGVDSSSGGVGLFDIYLSNSGGNAWSKDTSFTGTQPLQPESVMGFSGGDVYIGGSRGVYRLSDGVWGNWQQILSGDYSYNGQSASYAIWGESNASVWFTGDDASTWYRLVHYDGDNSTTLSTTSLKGFGPPVAITGTSASDVFIAAINGMIVHSVKSVVSSMTAVPEVPVHDVCGTDGNALFAVGDAGVILSYDGIEWRPMQSPTQNDLASVCGTSSAMFAAGSAGTVLYYDGSVWSSITSGTTQGLSDVWCLGSNAALVVGSNGTILQCTTQNCAPQLTDGTIDNLYAVYHSDLGSFAAGDDGIFMQKDTTDNTWKKITGTSGDIPANDIFDLWGDADAGFLVAVGEDTSGRSYIHKYTVNTKTWTQEYTGGNTSSQSLRAIAGTTWSDLYVVGKSYNDTSSEYDGIILHQENGSFTPIKNFPSYHFSAAWTVSGNLVVGASSYSQFPFYRYDGTHWLGMAGRHNLHGIGGSSRDTLMVVGDGGLVMQYNGTGWTSSVVDGATGDDLGSVYVHDSGQWALAASGDKIFRYNGTDWSQTTIPGGSDFSDFWGTGDKVFAVGNNVLLFSNNSGRNWQQETLPDTSPRLSGIWGAGTNGPFFATGHSWDGSRYHATLLSRQSDGSWAAMNPHGVDYMWLGDIWGNASDNVYAVGETPSMLGENETEILHFNGSNWQQVFYSHNVEPPQSFSAVTGTSKDDVYAFGSTTYHKDQCGSSWAATGFPGIPSLISVWGVDGSDGYYYLYGVGTNQLGLGDSVYRLKISMDKKCSSPWSLFLPAILSERR